MDWAAYQFEVAFTLEGVVDFCDVWLRSEEVQPLPSSMWGSRTEGDYPYCSSLRRLHPRAWRLGGGAPLPLHQDRMLVSALPLSSSSPSSFPTLLHLCLYLSLLLKMLFPSPVPQGSSWWKNKREGEIFFVRGEERRKSGKQKQLKGRGGRNGKEGEEHLTLRQKDNFGQAALFKVKAWFAFQKRRPVVLPPQGHHRTNQRVI